MMANERNLVAVSIKHTEYKWKFGQSCVLWGRQRTQDNEERCFSGYTQFVNEAEVYSLEDWKNSGYWQPCMKIDEPVTMCANFCKKYKKYDTVLVSLEQYVKYCECAGLPLDRPKEA